MKTLLSALLITLVVAGPVVAQNTRSTPLPPQVQPRREVLPGQPTPLPRSTAPRAAVDPGRRPATASQDLGRNITLQFQGSLLGSIDLDLALTGCGPQFATDFAKPAPEGTPPNIISINAVVKETVGGLRVEYSLGARVAMVSGSQVAAGGRVSKNVEFRDMTLVGAVVVKPGEPIVLSKLNDKTLTLTMTETAQAK